MNLSRRSLLKSTAATAASIAVPVGATADGEPLAVQFDVLSDELLARTPTTATRLGLDKGIRTALKSQLPDRSWDGVLSSRRMCSNWIDKLKAVPGNAFSTEDALNRDVVLYALQLGADSSPFDFGDNTLESAMGESSTPYVVSQQRGLIVSLPEFLNVQHKIDDKADADAYLARLEAMAIGIDQETSRIVRDASDGVILPDFLMKTTLGQISRFCSTPAESARLVVSLATRTAEKAIGGDYRTKATTIVSQKIYPAAHRQLDTLSAIASKATHDAGVWRFKDGDAYYKWLLRVGTSTEQTAAEIHRTGLDQTASIAALMDAILRQQGFSQGSVGERLAALGNDPRYVYPDNDAGRAAVIAYLNTIIAQTRPVMPEISRLNLKAPVIAKAVPVEIQDGASLGYMSSGALDGSRPSVYYINLKNMQVWPKYSLPTLTYHETIPGHAWQLGYMTESGAFPVIRNILNGFNAYVEGWALYAEQLADEVGLYNDDPLAKLGYLQQQQFRACRLVADTGLHAMQWSREQTVQ